MSFSEAIPTSFHYAMPCNQSSPTDKLPRTAEKRQNPTSPNSIRKSHNSYSTSFKMVFLSRSITRLARHPQTPLCRASLYTSARHLSSNTSRVLSRGARASALTSPATSNAVQRSGTASCLQNGIGSIRTLTGVREKVKVLLVLYDGGKHAEEVRYLPVLTTEIKD